MQLHHPGFDVYDALSRGFLDMFSRMERVDASLRNVAPPLQCHVTTMTFVAKLSVSLPITTKVFEEMEMVYDDYWTTLEPCKFAPSSSFEMRSTSLPSVRVKLFNKGSVQLTGAKTHLEAMHTLVEVSRLLASYMDEPVTVTHISLALMNVNVTLTTGIRLTRFAETVRANGVHAEQPERPPSCIVRLSKSSALVYKSGKFVLCATCSADAARLYGVIMTTLDIHAETREDAQKNIHKTRGHYVWNQLVQRGMPGALHTHPPTTRVVAGCPYCQRWGNVFASAPN
jgi:TATA-box binding protein (TBP) (component of TFIID and TFIIIB)